MPDRRPRGRPRDPSLDAAILAATLRLLAESGYHGMSVGDVAATAGTSKVTLYSRFPTKAALVGAALSQLHFERDWTPSGAVADDLAALLAAMRREYASVNGMGIVGACLTAETDNPELLGIVREQSFRLRRAGFAEVLRRGIEAGELRADTDVDLAVSVLLGAYYADYFADRPMDAEWDRAVVALVLRGLRTP